MCSPTTSVPSSGGFDGVYFQVGSRHHLLPRWLTLGAGNPADGATVAGLPKTPNRVSLSSKL